MHSINFYGATAILGIAQGYLPLAVLRTEEKGVVIHNTYWKPTKEEIEMLAAGHMIHLGVLGSSHPPVMVAISNVPVEELAYKQEGLDNDQLKRMQTLGYKFEGTEKVKLKCQVCDGTGMTFMPGYAHKSEGMVPCRFCHGGYLDAAN